MKKIRNSSEEEVVLNFLLGEIESERFSQDLLKVIKNFNYNESIITKADLKNEEENIIRKEILGEFRGYNKNKDLFENFPNITKYTLCNFFEKDLENIFYINYSYWNELSNHTSSPLEAVKNIKNDKTIYDVSNEPFIKGYDLLKEGKTFLPLILLTHDNKSFIVLEGHSRITIYAMDQTKFNNIKCFVLECSKEDLIKWNS